MSRSLNWQVLPCEIQSLICKQLPFANKIMYARLSDFLIAITTNTLVPSCEGVSKDFQNEILDNINVVTLSKDPNWPSLAWYYAKRSFLRPHTLNTQCLGGYIEWSPQLHKVFFTSLTTVSVSITGNCGSFINDIASARCPLRCAH